MNLTNPILKEEVTKEYVLYLSISINFRNRQDCYVRCEDTGITGESGVLFLYVYSSYVSVLITRKCYRVAHFCLLYCSMCMFLG